MSEEAVGGSSLTGNKDMLRIDIQDANRCSEDDKKWLKNFMDEQTVPPESVMCEKRICKYKIDRVPWLVRKKEADSSDCYDPLVVSIGPYHHGKPMLQFMEKLKYAAACLYAEKNQQKLEEFYTKVMHVAKGAREFYNDDDEGKIENFDDMEFIRMMFLDGCFVLQFIYGSEDLKIKDNIAACVLRDLCLLENQLPFQVLKELMKLRFNEKEWQEKLTNFIERILEPPLKYSHSQKLIIDFESEHAHLLDVIRTQLIGKSPQPSSYPNSSGWSSYRSAKELKAEGIHFKPSESRHITDVTFKSGILTLPPIKVDDSTKSMLLNMVAYEASRDGPNDFSVSSYICFLDSLIDHPEDVKELRLKGILVNFLGSNQQVADLFNQIADGLVPIQLAYAFVKEQIEKHYRNKITIWVAEWLHTHLTSPWSLLTFIGTVIALFLTFIQTYVAVYPP